jgi:hypothetical protein
VALNEERVQQIAELEKQAQAAYDEAVRQAEELVADLTVIAQRGRHSPSRINVAASPGA